jgi:mannose-6-phosphate isomerase-like protein (cupin superfamily)
MLPELVPSEALQMHHISPQDTVRLAVLAGPDVSPVTVMFESWDVGGAQPPNSHPNSTEIFVMLRGQGIADCDGNKVAVRAGDTLVLPPGSVHFITNTGTSRMYALTLMTPDDGFADVVLRGPLAHTDDEDRSVLADVPARL